MIVHAVYASTSGNVEAVVEKVAQVLRDRGIQIELHRAEQTPLSLITAHSHFIIATSTWEHGELNPFFVPLYKEFDTSDLSGKKAAFIGLGDTRYEPVLFCGGMEIVKSRWLEKGGQQLGQTMKINGEPYHHLEGPVTQWAQAISDIMKAEGAYQTS